MPDGQCFVSALSGTTSSSNTMVPGNDGHHDSKIKDSNMEDRYKLKYSTILFVLNRKCNGKSNTYTILYERIQMKHSSLF